MKDDILEVVATPAPDRHHYNPKGPMSDRMTARSIQQIWTEPRPTERLYGNDDVKQCHLISGQIGSEQLFVFPIMTRSRAGL